LGLLPFGRKKIVMVGIPHPPVLQKKGWKLMKTKKVEGKTLKKEAVK
jgi:hypothetical protein